MDPVNFSFREMRIPINNIYKKRFTNDIFRNEYSTILKSSIFYSSHNVIPRNVI